jgi:hypothetical protein
MAAATIMDVMKFMGKRDANAETGEPGGIKGFQNEWKALSDEDKEQLKQGVGDGTLTY